MTKFVDRRYDSLVVKTLKNQGIPEPLARAFSSRGVKSITDLDYDLKALLPPSSLLNCDQAGELIAEAILENKKITIVGDYDCDGATAVAVGILGLTALGAKDVSYIVPDRQKDGYGLSIGMVDQARASGCELLITVDNGISSNDAIGYATALGIQSIVTDHHLPGSELPKAACIVNPNQPGDTFASKFLAGVGVMFYVLLSTRAALRKRGVFTVGTQPNLASLLDLVAVGTVADVVPLDHNNRIIVSKGLQKFRAGRIHPGLSSLLLKAGRNAFQVTINDFGFLLAPRINAAGRMSSIASGVECLISPTVEMANTKAEELEYLNKERKIIEQKNELEAMRLLGSVNLGSGSSVALKGDDWHEGVIGLVANRIKDKSYRPAIAFAKTTAEDGTILLKGSGRSIEGVHLRDVLAYISERNPGIILKFGGHAMAAGLTIEEQNFEKFKNSFEEAVRRLAIPGSFEKSLATDGELNENDFTLTLAKAIQDQIWGTAFPEPVFTNTFKVVEQKIIKERHLKLKLELNGRKLNAIWFRRTQSLPRQARLAYKIGIDEWNGFSKVQIVVEAIELNN